MYIGIKNCMAAIEIKSENKIIHTENQHFIAIFRYANTIFTFGISDNFLWFVLKILTQQRNKNRPANSELYVGGHVCMCAYTIVSIYA